MSMLVKVLLVAALVLSIMVPFGAYFLGQPSRSRYKRSLGCNCFFFFGTLALAAVLAYGGDVHAAETAAENRSRHVHRSGIYRSSAGYQPFRYRFRYCRSVFRKRGTGRNQRGSEHLR